MQDLQQCSSMNVCIYTEYKEIVVKCQMGPFGQIFDSIFLLLGLEIFNDDCIYYSVVENVVKKHYLNEGINEQHHKRNAELK